MFLQAKIPGRLSRLPGFDTRFHSIELFQELVASIGRGVLDLHGTFGDNLTLYEGVLLELDETFGEDAGIDSRDFFLKSTKGVYSMGKTLEDMEYPLLGDYFDNLLDRTGICHKNNKVTR